MPPAPRISSLHAHPLTGGYEAAVDGFRQATRLRPEKHTHFTCLGKVYLRWRGHEEEALEALEESLRLQHTSVAANLAAKARLAIERAKQVWGVLVRFCLFSLTRVRFTRRQPWRLLTNAGGGLV